ncbi:MAG: hypothetical protein ACE5O2_17050 [Armatimonadota bacterium]
MREAARDVVASGTASVLGPPADGRGASKCSKNDDSAVVLDAPRALREGVDFASQEELRSLLARRAKPRSSPRRSPASPVVRDPAREASAAAIRLADAILDDLEMLTWTGHLPDGASWTSHAWWRVHLWQTFWRERDRQIVRRARQVAFWDGS